MLDPHDWKQRLNALLSRLVEESISAEELSELEAVSYTHLTLPTIYSV